MTNYIVPHIDTPAQAISPERARACGVGVDQSHFWMDEYTGTAEALIAAGVIAASQIPGQPGVPKYAATYYAGMLRPSRGGIRPAKDEKYLAISRPAKGKKIRVIVGLTTAERQRREEERDGKHKLGGADSGKEKYRALCRGLLLNLAGVASSQEATDTLPFRLAAAHWETLRVALGEALRVIEAAEILPVASARNEGIEIARSDSAFQTFMQNQGFRDFSTRSNA